MSPRGAVPISGMIEVFNMESVRLFRATFSHYISIENLKKNCLDIGRKPTVSLVSDMANCSLCPLFFLT